MTDLPLRGRSIVCLSSIDWDFLWQGHQEIATRLAAAGNSVLFVENTGVRTVRPSDLGRIAWRLLRWARQAASRPSPRPGVRVVTPLLIPFPRSTLGRAFNRRVLIPRLARQLRQAGVVDPVIFTFLPTPNACWLIELLRTPRSVLVYYCIADFRELSDLGPALAASETAIVRDADLVFVQSSAFAARFRPLNSHVHEFQFGVNLDAFDPRAARDIAPELQGLPRPIIGYSGGLHRHLDVGLIAQVADSFPEASLVLVGPVQVDAGPLRSRANVHLLGLRSFAELPGLLAGFDVATIPYVRSAYTDTVFPTKLHEYLAMGLPVVSTDLPEVRKLAISERDVRVAAGADAFVTAVRRTLDSPSSGEDIARRSRLARERDWAAVVQGMAALIAAASRAGDP